MHHCSMCPVFTNSKSELIKHLIHRHRNAPGFIVHCSAKGCGSSFRNIDSFRKHCDRKHSLETDESHLSSIEDDMDIDNVISNDSDEETSDSDYSRQVQEAMYILKLKAGANLSQSSIQEIMLSTSTLIEQRLVDVKRTITNLLPTDIVDNLDMDNLFRVNTFLDLDHEYKQEKFFIEHLGYIKPITVKLGEENKVKKSDGVFKMTLNELNAYVVPFEQQLSQLLSMPEVESSLAKPVNDAFEISDFHDGIYMQNPYFQRHPNALLFGLYSDDFEVANPIGSHKKKHKLTVFYWILLNIQPQFRFKLQATQLLGIAKTSHVKKYGIGPVLQDFLSGMLNLHAGLSLTVNDVKKVFHGTLLCVFGDTPAAQLLGGFKEGVGFAEKPCRTCEITHAELDNSLLGETFPLRNEEEHRDRCDILTDDTLSKGCKQYWSKTYGVVSESVLLRVPDFCVTKCILHDPMHVLLEGVCKSELQLMLKHFIERKTYFTLKVLNQNIQNFPYSCEEARDKPQILEKKSLDNQNVLPMTAIETLHFMQLLPFLIGDKVPCDDEHWVNYLILLQITHMVLSPISSSETIRDLQEHILTHNRSYRKLYPDASATPKLHYATRKNWTSQKINHVD